MGLIVSYEGLLALKQRYIYGIHRVPVQWMIQTVCRFFFCSTAAIFVAAINSQIPKWLKGLSGAAIALACVGVILTIFADGVIIIGTVLVAATVADDFISNHGEKNNHRIARGRCRNRGGAKSWKTLQSRFQGTNLAQEYGNNRSLGRGLLYSSGRGNCDGPGCLASD